MGPGLPGNIVALPGIGTDQDAGSEDDLMGTTDRRARHGVVIELCLEFCLVVEPQGQEKRNIRLCQGGLKVPGLLKM